MLPRLSSLFRLVSIAVAGTVGTNSAGADQPNILFIVSDDLQACMGSYGNPICQTPFLDRLASEGVRFENAHCQYPVCGPSRASFMSGLYPDSNGIRGNSRTIGSFRAVTESLANHPSIGGFLRDHGYYSARVGKIYHMGVPGGIEAGDPGGDDPDSWDYAYNVLAPETFSPGDLELLSPTRTHYGSNFARLIVPDEQANTQADYLATSQAIAIIENRAGEVSHRSNKTKPSPGAPFFLAVGLVRPHVPSVAPKRLFDLYPENKIPLPEFPPDDLNDVPAPAAAMQNTPRYGMNKKQQKQAVAAYYATVTYLDEQVGRLLNTLDRLDLRNNTVVIFTSDHGFNLGEHDCWQKLSLWRDSTRVPLYISAPQFPQSKGKTARQIVELIDLYPTIAELTGLAKEAPPILQGQSLVPLLKNPARTDWPKPYAYTVTQNKGQAINTERYRYSKWGDQGEELYDHKTDPNEFTNLVDNPEHATPLKQLRSFLEDAQNRTNL
ncbi:MAG: sulfatase [Verrucomicrobiota bacterium]